MSDIQREISKVRSALVLDHPFFGALTMHGELVPDSSVKDIPHVDGEKLRVNPKRFAEMRHAERKGEVAAAFLACGLGHPFRRGDRQSGTWSKASSMLTGKLIRDAGMYLPDDWPMPPAGMTIDNTTTIESLYKYLKEQPGGEEPKGKSGDDDGDGEGEGKPGGDRPGDGDGGGGYGIDDPKNGDGGGKTEGEMAKAEAEWQISTVQAARAAKAMGNAPGWVEEMLEQILNPKVPWRSVLREFVELSCKNDYSWVKPNRRYSSSKIVMPGLDGEQMGKIGIFHDTSGSVSSKELEEFYSELSSILTEFPGTNALLIQADTRVAAVEEISTEDLPIKPHVKGRGGTSFRPPFEWVEENGEDDLACAIYFTDGECNDYPTEPDYPVLWVFTQEPRESGWCVKPPWGRLIVVDCDA